MGIYHFITDQVRNTFRTIMFKLVALLLVAFSYTSTLGSPLVKGARGEDQDPNSISLPADAIADSGNRVVSDGGNRWDDSWLHRKRRELDGNRLAPGARVGNREIRPRNDKIKREVDANRAVVPSANRGPNSISLPADAIADGGNRVVSDGGNRMGPFVAERKRKELGGHREKRCWWTW